MSPEEIRRQAAGVIHLSLTRPADLDKLAEEGMRALAEAQHRVASLQLARAVQIARQAAPSVDHLDFEAADEREGWSVSIQGAWDISGQRVTLPRQAVLALSGALSAALACTRDLPSVVNTRSLWADFSGRLHCGKP